MSEITKVLEKLANDATWALPTVVGAVPVDREKIDRDVKEAEAEIEKIIEKRIPKAKHQFEVYSYMADSTGYYIGTRKEQNHTVIAGSTKEALDKVFALRADEKRDHNYAVYAKVKSSKELV